MSIHHEMQLLGSIIAADNNLTVEVRGASAYSTPGRVVLPSIDRFEQLGEENSERLMHGLADHELGHAVDTDFEVFEQYVTKYGPAYKALANALEDGYVEARRGYLYPGSSFNLRKKNEWYWERGFGDLRSAHDRIEAPENLWAAFCLAATYVVRPHGGKTIEDIGEINPLVGAMLRLSEHELVETTKLYTETKQTHVVVQLAEDIFLRFAEESSEYKPQQGEGEGDTTKTKVEVTDAEEDSGGATEAEAEAEAEEADEDEDGEEEDYEEELSGTVQGELERFQDRDGKPLNPEGALNVQMQRVFEMPAKTRPYIVFDPSFDLEVGFPATQQLTTDYERFQEQAELATDSLVYAFESALHARREKRPVAGSDEGEVDSLMLPQFAVGAARADEIFVEYAAEEDENTAVAVLVDCSGSMGHGEGSKSNLARVCAIAMHEALQRCQVAHEVTGFTTLQNEHTSRHFWVRGDPGPFDKHFDSLRKLCVEAQAEGVELSRYARTCDGDARYSSLLVPIYGIFKDFGSDDPRGLVHINGISQNLDGEAVLWQGRRLAQRSERRRVMFVLSDGYPAGSHDNAQGARYLRESVERCMTAGVEVYGLGIMSRAVEEFYPIHWVCHDLNDLSDLAMHALTETMMRTRTEKQWVEGL